MSSSKRPLRIALIGAGKMARAHSHAFLTAARFFDLPVDPVLAVLVGHRREPAEEVARDFGWQQVSLDWSEVVSRADVDLVDVCTPNALHGPISLAAAEAGHAVICEKPLATSVDEAKNMTAAVERARVPNSVIFNYRYAPAVRHAHDLIAAGELGELREFRLHFLQDWLIDPNRLMSWRLSAEGGGGVLVDLGAHLIDMAHYLVGPITRAAACDAQSVKDRPDMRGVPQSVDVEDALNALLVTESGQIGMLSVSRLAGGYRCQNGFEIIGSKGSVRWEFQRMNELDVYLADGSASLRGWRTVSVTEPGIHPWASHWWATGHPVGYDATFVHQLMEFLCQLDDASPSAPRPPSFEDGLRCQRVLAAVASAAREQRWVTVTT